MMASGVFAGVHELNGLMIERMQQEKRLEKKSSASDGLVTKK